MGTRTAVDIRPERPADIPDIRAVNLAAFERNTEADLVDALRKETSPVVSLVAHDAEAIIGHILFSPVHTDTPSRTADHWARADGGSACETTSTDRVCVSSSGTQGMPAIGLQRIDCARTCYVLPTLRFPTGVAVRPQLRIRRAG